MSKNVLLKLSYLIGECVAENLPLKFTVCYFTSLMLLFKTHNI